MTEKLPERKGRVVALALCLAVLAGAAAAAFWWPGFLRKNAGDEVKADPPRGRQPPSRRCSSKPFTRRRRPWPSPIMSQRRSKSASKSKASETSAPDPRIVAVASSGLAWTRRSRRSKLRQQVLERLAAVAPELPAEIKLRFAARPGHELRLDRPALGRRSRSDLAVSVRTFGVGAALQGRARRRAD